MVPFMKFEHFALNVSSPIEWSQWYADNLGLEIVRSMDQAPFTHFLRDSSGLMMVEVYNNPPESVPDYANMDPLIVHMAFVSEDMEKEKTALLAAGATFESEVTTSVGDHLTMLRDPWGLALQLCQRGKSMLK